MSAFKGWRFSNNTFAANTARSHVKMLSLSTDTYAKLLAEQDTPLIAEILLVYEPVFIAYRDICQQYDFLTGDYRGATLNFQLKMATLPKELRKWEGPIRAVYVEDTPEEKAIFPKKRSPFLSGTYENKINALGALAQKTTADPALAGTGSLISSFYNSALAARLAQQKDEGSTGKISDLRENQRILLSEELMGVLGRLMFIHRHNLVEIERYFDLSLLRETGKENPYYEGIASMGIRAINHNFEWAEEDVDTQVKIKNLSNGTLVLTFYFAETTATQPTPPNILVLSAGEEATVSLGQLGFPAQLFLVQNSGPSAGKFSIEVVGE